MEREPKEEENENSPIFNKEMEEEHVCNLVRDAESLMIQRGMVVQEEVWLWHIILRTYCLAYEKSGYLWLILEVMGI